MGIYGRREIEMTERKKWRLLEENSKLKNRIRSLEMEIELYRGMASFCKEPCFPTKGGEHGR